MRTTYINGCSYYTDKNTYFPAISSVLRATQAPESLAALANWRKSKGDSAADRIAHNSRQRGIALHEVIKRCLHEQTNCICDATTKPYWESIQPILMRLSEVKLIEEVTFNHQERYAGRVDLVACYEDIPCVIEWTTAEEPKSFESKLYDKPLQAVAELGAVNRSFGDSFYGERIENVLIVVALPDKTAQIFLFERDRLLDFWVQWKKRLDLFYTNHGEQHLRAS